MESKYNFNSQICTTREQSECLLALGLKKETADCYYWQTTEPMYGEASGIWYLETLESKDSQEYFEYLDKNFGVCLDDDEEHYFIPAWSLGRLIKLMPRTAILHTEEGNVRIDIDMYAIEILVNDDSIAEAVSVIEWLIKEGNFNKEYLV